LLFDWDWTRTELLFRRAREINPAYTQAAAWYALFFLGFVSWRWDEAIDVARELHQGEPLSAYVTSIMGFCYSFGAHPDEGLEWAMRASPLDPTAFITLWSLQFAQYYARKYEASIATGDTLLAASGRHPWALLFSVLASVEYGDMSGARAIVTETEARSAREYISPFHRGYAAALIGDEEAANRLLREAAARRDPGVPVFCRLAGDVLAMRRLPAYQELLRALRLPGL
jgi:hypothetical protein